MQLTPRTLIVWAVCACLCALGGWKYADTISSSPPPVVAGTRTIHDTRIITKIRRRVIKVRVPAKIIHRYDNVIVWQTARYVFVYRGKRRVIPPHIVRVRYHHHHRHGGGTTQAPVAAVVGVAPPPVTITVPVTVDVPGPTTTVTGPTTTETLPQATTTVTVPTTITVPATSGS